MRVLSCIFVWTCLSVAPLAAQQAESHKEANTNPLAGQKPAIAAGEKRFKSGCAMCHGGNAEGGRGPKLVNNWELYRMSDEQLFNIIEHGIAGTSMPASNLPDTNVWELAAYVRSLSSPALETITEGDSAVGRQLFYGKARCSGCHAILGQGGKIAPDLSDVGARLTALDLRTSIEDPNAAIVPGFEHVTVTTASGTVVDGIAKEDSDYSLSVLDRDGMLHRWNKSDLRTIAYHKQSLMPADAGKSLAPDELQNVLAFLAKQALRPADPSAPRRRRMEE